MYYVQNFHKNVSLETRTQIAEYAPSLSLLPPEDVEIPRDVSSPVDGLTINKGYKFNFG
jgi:hypothetical protein